MIRGPGRLWRTLRPLRATQWFHLPLRRAQALLPAPRPPHGLSAGAVPSAGVAAELIAWGPGDAAARMARADAVLAGSRTYLGIARTLPPDGWDAADLPRLWQYQLHYLEEAEDLAWAWRLSGDRRYLDRLAGLLDGWWLAQSDGRGPGWEPYALAHRVVHWINALLLAGEALAPATRRRLLEQCWIQARSLARRPERHLQANHLQKDLFALAWVGWATADPAVGRWTSRWSSALWEEATAQVLPDGVHAERSPMYHAWALQDLLTAVLAARAAGSGVPSQVPQVAARMREVLAAVSYAGGGAWLLNDTALDAMPAPDRIAALASRALGAAPAPSDGMFAFAEGGWFGFRAEAHGERCFVDGAGPGPAHQPGHAHAGTFGFELHLAGHPLIVDPGIGGYEGHPDRTWLRSTAAHAAVAVAGEDSSEVWGTFRVGGRARVHGATAGMDTGQWRFTGIMSPWARPGLTQTRRLHRAGPGEWRVTDLVAGARGLAMASTLPLHPDWALEWHGDRGTLRHRDAVVEVESTGFAEVTVEPGVYSPRFGDALPARRLVGRWSGDGETGWTLRLDPRDPDQR